jgi:hypothetical protein
MQNFYAQINGLANEVMFFPSMNLFFSFHTERTLQTRLMSGQNVHSIGDSRHKIKTFMPNVRHHLEIIKCERCIKMNWEELWCDPDVNGLCRAVDDNGLILFLDEHHVSYYGSLIVGDYLRKLYDNFTEINNY